MRDELSKIMDGFKRTLNIAADLIVLNVLLLVCSLPVVTAGAAWVACYTSLLRIVRGLEPALPVKPFFVDFRKVFRQATLAWLLVLMCVVLIAGDYYFAVYVSSPPNRFFLVFSIAMAALLMMGVLWLLPLMARFDNTLKGHIKNAFLMATATLPRTLLAMLVQLSFYVLPLFMPVLLEYFGWFWLMFGLTLPLYLTAKIFQKQLDCIPQAPDETEPDEDKETYAPK